MTKRFWKRMLGLGADERDVVRMELLEADALIERNGHHVVILTGEESPIADDFIPSHLSKRIGRSAAASTRPTSAR
jgi:hypothetical protein